MKQKTDTRAPAKSKIARKLRGESMPAAKFPPHETGPSVAAHHELKEGRKHIKAAVARGKKTKGKKIQRPRKGSRSLLPKVEF